MYENLIETLRESEKAERGVRMMNRHEAAEVIQLYQYGIPGEVPPHSFDLNDETVEAILRTMDERDRAFARLCEWCGVCPTDRRNIEDCEIAAVGAEYLATENCTSTGWATCEAEVKA